MKAGYIILLLAISSDSCIQIEQINAMPHNVYPIRAGLVQRLNDYYPPEMLAASMGVPGYAEEKIYNYIMLGFWKCADVPSEAVLAWSKPIDYFGDDSVFGRTKTQIQANLRKKYNDGKSHIMVSAFGNREDPTVYSALECASKLATFVLDNNLDGCDINWQSESALHSVSGYQWLLNFHNHLRKLIPNHIVTHTASASFFISQYFDQHSYTELNVKINKTVNFYNIRYYNLGVVKYNYYEELFINSTYPMPGTSVQELSNKRGIDLKKIVIAKPVTPNDSTGSGYTDPTVLSEAAEKAYNQLKWFSGFNYWQYSSDVRGKAMNNTAFKLKQICAYTKECH